MSRIGLAPITIPENVKVEIVDGGDFNYKLIKVSGPNGELSESVRRGVKFNIDSQVLTVERENESKQNKSYHGLYRSLISNMIEGVTNGFSKSLEIVGIGYRAEQQGNKIIFSLGYSHKIEYEPPIGISIEIEDQTKIKVSGASKQKVGEVAAKIRSFRKPEPYKGKGIKYSDEQIRRKSAKNVGA
ncbi:MAG: 50S ribosomal protein L6 [Candidatus Dojkabacteria bacterium]